MTKRENIEQLTDWKFLDYLQEQLIMLLWRYENNPQEKVRLLKQDALMYCSYRNPDIDSNSEAEINKLLRKRLENFYDELLEKQKTYIE